MISDDAKIDAKIQTKIETKPDAKVDMKVDPKVNATVIATTTEGLQNILEKDNNKDGLGQVKADGAVLAE